MRRKDFDSFGTEEGTGFFDDVLVKIKGAVPSDHDVPELEKLTRGPLAMDVTMPLWCVRCRDRARCFV